MSKTPFQEAWDATNRRYIDGTVDAIRATYRRRHESKHVREACRSNIAFYREHHPKKEQA